LIEAFKIRYDGILRSIIKRWYIAVSLFCIALFSTYAIFHILPTGFIPNEDKGTLIVAAFAKPGTSLRVNEKIVKDIVSIVKNTKGISDVLEIGGYNLISGTVDTSAATLFIVLDDWDKRTTDDLQLTSIIANLQTKLNKVDKARVMVISLPSVPGLSSVGGFEYKLQNLQSAPLQDLEKMANEVITMANKDPRIMFASTSFNSHYPQYYLDIDRNKAYKLNVNMGDVFQVIQTYLGSLYVNDFNKFGKVYRVFIQADANFRKGKDDIGNFFVKNKDGDMVPLNSFIKIKRTSGAAVIKHFDGYQSITINGSHNLALGYSSTDAMKAMEEISDKVLSKGYSFQWAGMARQEKEAGNKAILIFALSLIFVFLFLSAQYESWMMPLMIMIPIPVVFLGALGANMLAGLLNNTYTQIGLVLLIGMSSKNAILIIEFAKELRESGKSIVESAIEASTLRLRAILMTIFSFLLGILPLLLSTGPGAIARKSLGTAVFGGMILSTILTLFFTPLLFVLLQRLREKRKKDA
jgi:HAE1 family hydrophobic/amphiphilic exporter-1/multidrug efflux pump